MDNVANVIIQTKLVILKYVSVSPPERSTNRHQIIYQGLACEMHQRRRRLKADQVHLTYPNLKATKFRYAYASFLSVASA